MTESMIESVPGLAGFLLKREQQQKKDKNTKVSVCEKESKLPRPTRVKNKSPEAVQITAEQLLREARERQEPEVLPSEHSITDSTELSDYRLRRRKEFEDRVSRGGRSDVQVWVNYARWEESQKDYARARSVWERALKDHHRNHALWVKYAESEMKNKFVNSARHVWDRAVYLLPRVDLLWYKYSHMEEMLGNIAGARQIFERWMNWSPDQQGWLSFAKFELRYNETERARSIYERFFLCHPKASSFIRYAEFEVKCGEVSRARDVYERAMEKLEGGYEEAEMLYLAFAEFEQGCNEFQRARVIYKFALDHIPIGRAEELYTRFIAFEKQHGDKQGIEDAIVGRRRTL
ncbi:PREDICTED: crooked neck-like protein 1 [Brassica oleracea var. oleracea]|uniref:crooked neck-like protein 1 n=1 Tax=Brassica oleracea var. oleracea TaxID=109376 RepID=UPI0006A6D283|nr:PREDICTED: crooked neck-like protein 1 [Brassica oleracea var. oleracea]